MGSNPSYITQQYEYYLVMVSSDSTSSWMYRRRNEQLVEAKSTYCTNKVEESKDDPKALFRLTGDVMGSSGENPPSSYL